MTFKAEGPNEGQHNILHFNLHLTHEYRSYVQFLRISEEQIVQKVARRKKERIRRNNLTDLGTL